MNSSLLLILLLIAFNAQWSLSLPDPSNSRKQADKDLRSLRKVTLRQMRKSYNPFQSVEEEAAEIAGHARDVFVTKLSLLTEKQKQIFPKRTNNTSKSSWLDCTTLFKSKIHELVASYRTKLEDYIYKTVDKYLIRSKSQEDLSSVWIDVADIHLSYYKCLDDQCFDDVSEKAKNLTKSISEGKISKVMKKTDLNDFREDIEDYALVSFISLYRDVKLRWEKMDSCLEFMDSWNSGNATSNLDAINYIS